MSTLCPHAIEDFAVQEVGDFSAVSWTSATISVCSLNSLSQPAMRFTNVCAIATIYKLIDS